MRTMIPGDLHDARLDVEMHANALERALGRGGAPIDLARALAALDPLRAALDRVAKLLMDCDGKTS